MPRACAVVVNAARVPDAGARRRVVERVLAEAGWPAPLWSETTADDPGAGQARRAVRAGAEVVFVCGGDGTVRSALEGLAGSSAALAVLPAGTSNQLASRFGVPRDTAQAVRVAVSGARRRLDVGDADGRAFAVMAGIGYPAALVGDASARSKGVLGAVAYVVSGVRHVRDDALRVHLRLDGGPWRSARARGVLVANIGSLGAHVRLAESAVPDDGALDVLLLTPRSLRQWVQLAAGVLLRRPRPPHLRVERARCVEVVTARARRRQLDGDDLGRGDVLRASVRPGAVVLCVPRSHAG